MKKITIITSTFNRAHTLEKAFESLCKQTFQEFLWLVLDDGSTDHTAEKINQWVHEKKIEIHYHQRPHRHKFLTVLEGIKMVKTPYFMVLDSDDAYPNHALEILFEEVERISHHPDFIGVMGLSADEFGGVVGDRYPGNGFDGSIFDMRYKHRVKGDKNGIFVTSTYHQFIKDKDFSHYEGKGYIPQSVLFNAYDAVGIKTRFINHIIRVYLKNEEDTLSVSNTRKKGENRFGLSEGHLSFLNAYGYRLLYFPWTLLKNLIGYQVYALASKRSRREILRGPYFFIFKVLGVLVFPLSFIYSKFI